MLPSDLLIFSPPSATTIPEWAQCRAKQTTGGLGLGPLVLVVGKGQILATAVEVEPFPQDVQRHDHALGVPARTARAPRRLPAGLTGLGRLPEGEIDRRALAGFLAHLHPGADPEALDGLASQQAVVGHALGREVDAVTADVGVPGRRSVARSGRSCDPRRRWRAACRSGASTPRRAMVSHHTRSYSAGDRFGRCVPPPRPGR